MKLVSWNVNGLRSIIGKGLGPFLEAERPELLCLQEVKAGEAQVGAGIWESLGYRAFWNSAKRPGYAGTMTLARIEPMNVTTGIGEPEGDGEGRVLTLELPDFYLVNVYTPNARGDLSRLAFRTQVWDPAFRAYLRTLDAVKPVVTCGDFNVAHEEIDLARPAANRRSAGFTDEERAAFSEHLAAGFIDSFREFEKGGGHYTWWSYRGGARGRNVGWRLDYFLASERLRCHLREAGILPHVLGSDHCPVTLEIA
jgi:exodeoxyribonuclease-3